MKTKEKELTIVVFSHWGNNPYWYKPHKWIVLFVRADWLAQRWLAMYYSPLSSRRKVSFKQVKLLFGLLVIQPVWYMLKQLFTSVSVKVVNIYLHGSCVLLTPAIKCRSILAINTLINPQSTSQLTLSWHTSTSLARRSIEVSIASIDWHSIAGVISTHYPPPLW